MEIPKIAALALVAALIMPAQSPQRAAQPSPQPGGRFQIYSLSYMYAFTSTSGSSMAQTTDVFRIDAETGSAWKFSSVVSNGKLDERWIKIEEPR